MLVEKSISERRRCAGVTLIELLVVAALASILLALVFPSIRAGMSSLALHSSAQRLASAAKFARDQAIFRQRPFQLEIDVEGGTITVFDSGGESRSFELPAGVRVGAILPVESQTQSQIRRFLFSPDGVTARFDITLETARRRVQVTTDPLTGFPRVRDL